MRYISEYKTKKEYDDIILTSDGKYLTGLYFKSGNDFKQLDSNKEVLFLPIFQKACKKLAIYLRAKLVI